MMQCVHLGWNRRLVETVAERLLEEGSSWDGLLLLIPTVESGKRLREALVRLAPGHAVIPPLMMTAEMLLERAHGNSVRDRLLTELAWARVICSHRESNALIRTAPVERTLSWGLSMADICLRARRTLGESMMRFADVVRHPETPPEEAERWQVLDDWEREAVFMVESWGGHDPLLEELDWIRSPRLPEGICRVVVACVPDPLPLAMLALQKWADAPDASYENRIVECWVHGPEDFAVDPWGRPIGRNVDDGAGDMVIPLPSGEEPLVLRQGPEGMVEEIVRFFAESGSDNSDCSIGLCDPAFAAAVRDSVSSAGWSVYRSGGDESVRTGVVRLLEGVKDAMNAPGDWLPVDQLCRSGVLAAALKLQDPFGLSVMLDELADKHIPQSLSFVLTLMRREDAGGWKLRDFEKILQWLEEWTKQGVGATAASLVERLQSAGWGGEFQEALLDRLGDMASVVASLEDGIPGFSVRDAMVLLCRAMKSVRVYADRDDRDVSMQDWMELAYDPAGTLVLAGMHEGCIPDNEFEDPLLPEGMKRKLRLRSRTQRFYRDAFLYRGMIESRRECGRVRVLVARENPSGVPCKPSSLLLQCPAEDLPERVLLLFGDAAEPPKSVSRDETGWHLVPPVQRNPWADQAAEWKSGGEMDLLVRRVSFSPSLFASFLSCPKRFWLEKVCRFERLDLGKEANAMQIGEDIHRCVERLGPGGDLYEERREEVLSRALQEGLMQEFSRKYGQELTLPLLVQRDYALQRLERMAAIHLQALREGWSVVGVEKKIVWVPWTDLPVELNMRIDRLEVNEHTGTLRVVDFKTGKGKTPEEAHLANLSARAVSMLAEWFPGLEPLPAEGRSKSLRRWRNLQLPLYVLAAENMLREMYGVSDVVSAYFNLPILAEQTGIVEWGGLNRDLLESAGAWAHFIADILLNRDLSVLPSAESLGWETYPNDPFAKISPDGLDHLFASPVKEGGRA